MNYASLRPLLEVFHVGTGFSGFSFAGALIPEKVLIEMDCALRVSSVSSLLNV